MNDLEFRQRAYANPWDDSPEFTAAANASEGRRQWLEELRGFEDTLADTLRMPPPEGLRERLLNTGSLDSPETGDASPTAGGESPAAGAPDSGGGRRLWFRTIPVAACLVLAAGLALTLLPNVADRQFEEDIFAHIYGEIDYLEADNDVSLPAVNEMMAGVGVGGSFQTDGEMGEVDMQVVDDCWIFRQMAVHMVMKSEDGSVTVMVIPHSPVRREFSISDERFDGIVTPTPQGSLVVVGEKQVPLARYKNLIANNISWQ